jgi:hypothetical protein
MEGLYHNFSREEGVLGQREQVLKTITLVQIRYSKNDLIGIINWSYVKLTGKSLFNSPFF